MKNLVKVANTALINSENEILVLKRSSKFKNPLLWGFPGGLVEENEAEESAAKRELFEETSITSEKYSITAHKNFLIGKLNKSIEITLFKAVVLSSVNVQIDLNEHIEYKWVPLTQVMTMKDIIHDIPLMLAKLLEKSDFVI